MDTLINSAFIAILIFWVFDLIMLNYTRHKKATDFYSQLRLMVQEPTLEPVQEPTLEPVQEPTLEPVQEPTLEPVQEPTLEPVQEPTLEPVQEPTLEPVQEPTLEPVQEPNLKLDYYATQYSIRELKKLASVAKITGYSKMTKRELAMELAKQDI